ncbi:MAG: 7-carboxy-7-deazaguanine synthase QueE [Elusimicrobia bacterium]|nr:7-carboxy-7-deazaguanine synthase QueE [Elusimicrobiota bacterium]
MKSLAEPALDARAVQGVVSEIFSSLQGEGIFLGEKQIFIRLAGCPWRCSYCDTPASLARAAHTVFSTEELLREVRLLQRQRPHRSASLTGGEPLMQTAFLQALLPRLRREGLRTYLETSGTHPDLLRRVIDECDVVAMDIKLPSAIGQAFWKEHSEFLAVAGAKAFVKIVLTSESTDEELERALDLAESADAVPPVVLQPVTAISPLASRLKGADGLAPIVPPSPQKLADWLERARARLPDVRLTPQMHPIWGLR